MYNTNVFLVSLIKFVVAPNNKKLIFLLKQHTTDPRIGVNVKCLHELEVSVILVVTFMKINLNLNFDFR